MLTRFPLRLALLVLALLAAAPAAGEAQERHPLQEARSLREAGRPDAAVPLVRGYLSMAPDDTGARWLLAQLLVEAGDPAAALPEYEHALRLEPGEAWLRLEYARALIDAQRFQQARTTLQPLADAEGAQGAAAQALLGSLDYWSGDLAAASRRFRRALALQPDHAEAARQLQEIRDLTMPLVGSAVLFLSDDQPLSRIGGELTAAFFPEPNWRLGATLAPAVLESELRDRGQLRRVTATAVEARAEITGYLPAARLEPGLAIGVAHDATNGTGAVGEGSLALRLPREVALRAAAGRRRYLATAASLDTLLLYQRAEVRLDRAAAPAWAGEAVLRAERFPDANVIRTAYAWVLAPLLPALRVGLSTAWQDADASTWTEAERLPTLGAGPPPAGGFSVAGRYDPYYTPHSVRVQAVLGEVAVPLADATFRVSGSYGFHARELAPEIRFSGAPPVRTLAFPERAFNPWRAGASLDLPVSPGTLVRLDAEHETTAFYAVTRVSGATTWRPRARPSR